MAQFGNDAAGPFDELNGIVHNIFVSARMLPYCWRDQGHRAWSSPEEFEGHLEQMRREEAVFWEISSHDAINRRLDEAVTHVEAICGRIIREPRRRPFPLRVPLQSLFTRDSDQTRRQEPGGGPAEDQM